MPSLAASASAPRLGALFAIGSMSCVQLGLAASVGLSEELGPTGVAWLRLVWAGLILIVIARPWRAKFTKQAFWTCVALGVATAAMTIFFMCAVMRIPLGTASALEFLGPLGVAVARGSGRNRLWALVAAAGVVALTEPWRGQSDLLGILFALGAAAGWAVYILLTQRAGDTVEGLNALAVSIPTAAIAASFTISPALFPKLDLGIIIAGLGLALLLPLIPFTLELLSLRRLNAAKFGTLMSLEPAFALIIGAVFLQQIPSPLAVAGITLVIAAGIGLIAFESVDTA